MNSITIAGMSLFMVFLSIGTVTGLYQFSIWGFSLTGTGLGTGAFLGILGASGLFYTYPELMKKLRKRR